jgi:hypothetical protein
MTNEHQHMPHFFFFPQRLNSLGIGIRLIHSNHQGTPFFWVSGLHAVHRRNNANHTQWYPPLKAHSEVWVSRRVFLASIGASSGLLLPVQ